MGLLSLPMMQRSGGRREGEVWMMTGGLHRWMNMSGQRKIDGSGSVFVCAFKWECQWVDEWSHW